MAKRFPCEAVADAVRQYHNSDDLAAQVIVVLAPPGAVVPGPFGEYRKGRRSRIRYRDQHGTRTEFWLSQVARGNIVPTGHFSGALRRARAVIELTP